MKEPGEKIDLSTLIAYLLPGLIILMMVLATVDSSRLITGRSSFIRLLPSVSGPQLVMIAGSVLIAGYTCGLLLDLFAHRFFDPPQDRIREDAYAEVCTSLAALIDADRYRALRFLTHPDPQTDEMRSSFVDTMFYHYATPQQWERQNWSWAFYESSRNLSILFLPAYCLFSFYLLLGVTLTSLTLSALGSSVLCAAITLGIGVVILKWPYQWLKEYRGRICKVYYKHRAYIVIGLLIDRSLFQP